MPSFRRAPDDKLSASTDCPRVLRACNKTLAGMPEIREGVRAESTFPRVARSSAPARELLELRLKEGLWTS